MPATRRLFVCLTLSLPALLSGCDKGYKLAPVSGRVMMDNRPLAHAEVKFFPTAGNDLPYASGVTDEQGNFKLEAFIGNGTADGAVVGENRVSISLSRLKANKPMTPQEMKAAMGHGLDLLPARYNSKSTMTFTVPPEGTTAANFEVTSK